MSTDMSYIIFCLIMFVIESGKTSGMSLKKGVQLETTHTSGNLPVFGGDWENENYDAMTTRRKKEVAGNVITEEKLNHMKILLENFYKYNNFRKPKTSNALISNNWGAGGMPFNVLYTPNSHQQKILRFVPKGNPKESTGSGHEVVYKTADSQRRKQQQQQQQHVTPRKYFSVIPQLFAWRPRY